MKRKRLTAEQIIRMLREADTHLSQGKSVKRVEHIWRQEGLKVPQKQAKRVRLWLKRRGVRTLYLEPDSPWEKGYCESFNGKLRDELLDREIFYTLKEAQVLIERWRKECNTFRLHSTLNYRPPAPEPILTTWIVHTVREPPSRSLEDKVLCL